jgi:hypothetical protein
MRALLCAQQRLAPRASHGRARGRRACTHPKSAGSASDVASSTPVQRWRAQTATSVAACPNVAFHGGHARAHRRDAYTHRETGGSACAADTGGAKLGTRAAA